MAKDKTYRREWYRRNLERNRKYAREYQRKLRERLRTIKKCLICQKDLDNNKRKYCPECLKIESARNRRAWGRNRYKELRRNNVKHYNYKLKALQLISKQDIPSCVRCNLRDIRILTINHKAIKSDEEKIKRNSGFYIKVALGKRDVEDLEVRCYNCNILYEYEKGRCNLPEKFSYLIENENK